MNESDKERWISLSRDQRRGVCGSGAEVVMVTGSCEREQRGLSV